MVAAVPVEEASKLPYVNKNSDGLGDDGVLG